MTIRQAVQTYLDADLADFSLAAVRAAIQKAGVPTKPEWMEDRDFLFSLLMDRLQEFLGREKPVFLHDWPSFQCASTPSQGVSEFAERSELFIAGIEISDGFPTLTDYERQVEGFALQAELRRKNGQPEVPLDERYLQALKSGGMPRGAGMALGFDRVVMLLTGQKEIKRVLAFAWDEA